jgi:hypothetical protein
LNPPVEIVAADVLVIGGLLIDVNVDVVFLKLLGIILEPTPLSLSCLLSHDII